MPVEADPLHDPLGDGGGALAIEVTRQAVVRPNVEVECVEDSQVHILDATEQVQIAV